MKTYLFPEVAGHGEITEWVPADVARELLEALDCCLGQLTGGMDGNWRDDVDPAHMASAAIKKSCGEL